MSAPTAEQAAPKRGPGRPSGSGEGRDKPITWRTTPERGERLAAAAARLAIPKSQALDAALDAWLKKHS